MTDEEMRRTIEFLLDQQAKFAARMEADEIRLSRLEDAFVTVVQLAKITDQRLDALEMRADTFERRVEALVEAQALANTKLAELVQAQEHTDENLNSLINVVERYISEGRNGNSGA